MFKKFAIALLPLVLVTFPAYPSEVVGKAVVDGNTVLLHSDNTWEYDAKELGDNTNCETLSKKIVFCNNLKEWKYDPDSKESHLARYDFDDKNFGIIIEEELGTTDGLSFPSVRKVVLENAAKAIGKSAKDIEVISVNDIKFANSDASDLLYKLKINGLDVVVLNTIVLSPTHTVQMVTFTFSDTYEPAHRKIHDKFLSAIKISN